jgi:oxygen-independent coproporphyrinogen-3 oxidase
MSSDLLQLDPDRIEAVLLRYSGAGPRYTSYPTAPSWSERYGTAEFREDLGRVDAAAAGGISVYVHVPFCSSLCHFCACNRIVTRKAELPEQYLDTLAREVEAVREALPGEPRVAQHHWGGGTPTHLSPAQVQRLFRWVDAAFPAQPGAEISVEVDPRVTTPAHLEALRECGFNRISLGVQDFDRRVQQAIHREQSVEETAALVQKARALGFESVNFDLIYGLPFQTVASFERTLASVAALAPDRIALYAYAHVTWVAKQQRGFERTDLPAPKTRLRILLAAIQRLLAAGFDYVGLDHFARPEDELCRALTERTLRRNFMGYTTRAGLELLGFGASAISELEGSYAQSHRDLDSWERAVREDGLATLRGHRLSRDDSERRWVISQLMCHGEVAAADYHERFGDGFAGHFARELARLEPLEADGLVVREPDGSLRITPLGRLVARNVAMAFDAYLEAQRGTERPLFSQTV